MTKEYSEAWRVASVGLGWLESQELRVRLGEPLQQEAAGLPWTAHHHEPVCPSGQPEGAEMMLFILFPAILSEKNTVERVSVLSKLSTTEKAILPQV